MDLDRLRYFSVIAETGSLRRAAQLLGVSSPALSKAVRLLEDETRARLLVHSSRGILVTDQGRLLATRARAILRELDSLRAQIAAGEAEEKPLRLGSFDVFTTYFVGQLASRHLMKADQPIVVHDLAPGHLERALAERHIDVGITYVPVPSADLEELKISRIEMGIFARKGCFERLPLEQLPFAAPVTPLVGGVDRVRGLDGWPENGVPRMVRYQVTLMESAIELCRQGLAVAYLPRFVARLHNERVKPSLQLVEIPFEVNEALSAQFVYIVKRKTDLEGELIKKIAKAIRLECRSTS